jgi:hypothetical protein
MPGYAGMPLLVLARCNAFSWAKLLASIYMKLSALSAMDYEYFLNNFKTCSSHSTEALLRCQNPVLTA